VINSRNKGKVFERLVANLLKTWPGLGDARRGLTQSGGAIEPDVTALAWPFWTELKSRRRVDVRAALAQAQRDTLASQGAARPTLMIGRDTGGDIFFAVPWTYAARKLFAGALGFYACQPGWGSAGDVRNHAQEIVCTLTRGTGWRNFREELAPLTGCQMLVVEDEVAIGWVETLEHLWVARQK
jgi:hypothetical protein